MHHIVAESCTMNRTLFVALLMVTLGLAASAQQFGRIKFINAYPFLTDTAISVFVYKDSYVVKSVYSLQFKDQSDWFYLPYDTYDDQLVPSNGTTTWTYGTFSVSELSTVFVLYSRQGLYLYGIADDTSVIPAGKSRVTVGQFAFGFSEVDVGAGLETSSLASNLSYANISLPDLGNAGSGSITVRTAGTSDTPDISQVVTLEPLKSYLVLIVGYTGVEGPTPMLATYELTDYSLEARLAFSHALPAGSVGLDLVADGSSYLFRNIKYTRTTNYINIPAGYRSLQVMAGTAVVFSASAFLNGFTESTLYAVPTVSNSVGVLLYDENVAPAPGDALVRVIQGALTSPVDVLVNGNQIFSNLGYGVVTPYFKVTPGVITGQLNVAGTQTLVYQGDLNVTSGAVITLVVAGVQGTTGDTAVTVFTNYNALYGNTGGFRAFHALATFNGPTVNVKINGAPFVDNMTYANFTVYGLVPSGLYKVSVHAASDDQEIFRSPIRVNAGLGVTALIGGNQNPSIMELVDFFSQPAPGTALIRGVHASATISEILLTLNGALAASLIYPEVFGYTPVNTSSPVAANIVVKGANTVLFNGNLTDDANTVVSYFAVGIINDPNRGFKLIRTLDYDFRTPVAPVAPVAAPANATAPAKPPRTSSATLATVSLCLMMIMAALF